MSETDTSSTATGPELLVALAKLTKKQRIAVYQLIDAYESFWDHIKFRKGWAEDDTSSLIGQVAEIVVRIRSELDAKEEGLKLRQLEGTAKEYLWQMQEDKRKPHDDEKQFVRDMVHATFKDANGYLEGLTKETLDSYIDAITKFMEAPKEPIWGILNDPRKPEEVIGTVKRQKRDFGGVTLTEYAGVNCDGAVVLECFPSVGLMSVMVGNKIVKEMGLPLIGHLSSEHLQVACIIQNEQPVFPARIYGNKDVVIFVGEMQVPEDAASSLVDAIYDFAHRHSCKMIYTLEGIPSKDTYNIDGQPVQLRIGAGGGNGGGGDEDSEGEGEGEQEQEATTEDTLVVDDILLTKLTLREEHEQKKAAGTVTSPAPLTPSKKRRARRALKEEKKKEEEEKDLEDIAEERFGKLIHYATTDLELAHKLRAQGLIPLVDAIIPGVTGGILAKAPEMVDQQVTALLSSTSVILPDPRSAIPVIKLLDILLPHHIDLGPCFDELRKDGENQEKMIRGLLDQTLKKSGVLSRSGSVPGGMMYG